MLLRGMLHFFANVFRSLANGLHFFRIVIRDFDVKGLLKFHYQFRVVEGVNAKVFYKAGIGSNL